MKTSSPTNEQAIRNLAAVDTDNLEAEPLFAADYADA